MKTKFCFIRHADILKDPRDFKMVHALIEAGHAVDVFCLRRKGGPLIERQGRLSIFRIPLHHRRGSKLRYIYEYGAAMALFFLAVSYAALFRNYRCVQVCTMPDFLVFATLIPRILGAKILIDVHEPTAELWLTKYGSASLLATRLLQGIQQLAIRYAHAAITVTGALKQHLVDNGSNPTKIIVIPNVCAEDKFSDAIRREPKDRHTLKLITHGLIEPRYGHDVIVRAIAKIKEALPLLECTILGDGPYRRYVEELSQVLHCEEQIRFLGFVPFEEMVQRLKAADIGLVTMKRSPYADLIETNKMYDFIALHKPVIISRLKAVEQEYSSDCMMFFNPEDADDLARCILDLALDPQKQKKLADNAFRHYETIRWEVTKKKYLDWVQS